MSSPRPLSVPMSPFLAVPLEIRRNIYRILLLDPSETYLSTPWEQQDDHDLSSDYMNYGTGYQGDFFEDHYNDEDKDAGYYLSMDQAFRARDLEAPWVKKSIWKIRDGDEDSDLDVRRYPNILRTNRQIYSEASSMLYSELRVVLQPGDVLCMKPCKDIVKASEKVWRHNPLDSIGTTNATGQTVYSKPSLDGVMEPHVLARFKRFAFELDINWELETLHAEGSDAEKDENRGKYIKQHGVAPSLLVHENMTVDPQDEANLLAFYKHSTLIHQLVKILSNSPDIVSLDMSFDLQVLVRNDLDLDSDLDDDDQNGAQLKTEDVANGRAMEIFMDGGFLAPLEKLSNVRSFEFRFSSIIHNCEDYEPKPRHKRMLTELKQKIKDNYARRN
ncbi:hypothetical protein BDR22DRAFT_500454 [Usnea florida]